MKMRIMYSIDDVKQAVLFHFNAMNKLAKEPGIDPVCFYMDDEDHQEYVAIEFDVQEGGENA